MSKYDVLYKKLCEEILLYGYSDEGEDVRTHWKDGSKAYTKSLLNYQLKFDNSEVPILTTKFVAWKTAIKELLWIWQLKSNDVNVLNEMGVKIWDEWKQKDGTIGTAYGHQMGKKVFKRAGTEIRGGTGNSILMKSPDVWIDQVDNLLYNLKNHPYSRRHMTSLWSIEDLDDMALTPCVWATHWQVQGRKLHLTVLIRSNDVALGQPFNCFQYYVLQRVIAQVTGYEMGTLTFNIDNAHIYTRHIDPILNYIVKEQFQAPILNINPNINDFYKFTIDDFELKDYKNCGKVDMEVAI